MNVYEAFGLLLVAGMVVMLVMAAHALGEPERLARRAERAVRNDRDRARDRGRDRENSDA